MMTLSLVGSPDATPCANAPWISACATWGESSDATRSKSAPARAKRADRNADDISRSLRSLPRASKDCDEDEIEEATTKFQRKTRSGESATCVFVLCENG
jgi:hypothetical protein